MLFSHTNVVAIIMTMAYFKRLFDYGHYKLQANEINFLQTYNDMQCIIIFYVEQIF